MKFESTNEWIELFVNAAVGNDDIVEILASARAGEPEIGNFCVRAALCARKALGLSIRQSHFIAGWLVGEVDDQMLRREVPVKA